MPASIRSEPGGAARVLPPMDDLPDLTKLTDAELVALYSSKEPDDPDIDRIANEMEARGVDF